MSRSVRFALRAGYEFANRGWLIYSTTVETNFEHVTVAPLVEAALPTSWHVHWAAGAGIPVELVDPQLSRQPIRLTRHGERAQEP